MTQHGSNGAGGATIWCSQIAAPAAPAPEHRIPGGVVLNRTAHTTITACRSVFNGRIQISYCKILIFY